MYLFEFLDQDWLPKPLRTTMLELLEMVNVFPFRSYGKWVAEQVIRLARQENITHIVELGAGAAPLTKALASRSDAQGIRLTYCDHFPDKGAFAQIAATLGDRVQPIYEPVDFSLHRDWPPGTLLVISAAFHHVRPGLRRDAIESLSRSAAKTVVFEPLRRNVASILFVLTSVVPAALLPAVRSGPGRLRRVLWCWLLPLVPLLFIWDGIVSALRQWNELEWHSQIHRAAGEKAAPRVSQTLFTQMIVW